MTCDFFLPRFIIIKFFFGLLLTHNFLHDRASSSSTIEFSSISWKPALIVKHNYNGKSIDDRSIDRQIDSFGKKIQSVVEAEKDESKDEKGSYSAVKCFFVWDLILDACGSGKSGSGEGLWESELYSCFVARQAGAGCWWISLSEEQREFTRGERIIKGDSR